MIGAVVTLVHFDGPGADRDAEHLMAETDAEGGNCLLDDVADHRHRILAGCRRVARAVGEKDPVRRERDDFRGRGGGRNHRHLAPLTGELSQDVALDAVVDRHHVEPRPLLPAVALVPLPRRLVPAEALRAGDGGDEVHADEPGHSRACRLSASRSNRPEGSCAITAFGMPLLRMRLVNARVSTPPSPITPRALSQASRWRVAR